MTIPPPLPDEIILKGIPEIVYFMLLLNDPQTVRWNGDGAEPQGMWVNTRHPKVLEAMDMLQAFPSIVKKPDMGLHAATDMFTEMWPHATDAQRTILIGFCLADVDTKKWVSLDGRNPRPAGFKVLKIDDPTVFPYLTEDWKRHVENIHATYAPFQKSPTGE